MYTQLIAKLNNTIDSITRIKERFNYPATHITKYPCALIYPVSFENDFESTQENSKVYKFKLFIVIQATTTTVENIFSVVLPEVVDETLEKFDADWNGGEINGHRIFIKIDSGDWLLSQEEVGLEAVAELNIEIKTLTTN